MTTLGNPFDDANYTWRKIKGMLISSFILSLFSENTRRESGVFPACLVDS